MSKELQPKPNRAKHRFLGGVVAAGLSLVGCAQGEPTTTSPSTKPNTSSTTIPGTTTELPTTSLEPKPTDVMDVYTDGSELLRNGGVLYKGEKNELPEWFGGIEIHIIDMDGNKTGLQEGAQNTILDSILWAFGNQHPEFIGPDGQVDIEAYKAYLEQNDWVDSNVYMPDNIAVGRSSFPPTIAKSLPMSIDYKLPFIIGNNDLNLIEGFKPENPNYYPGYSTEIRKLFGITNAGQIYFSLYLMDGRGVIKPAVIGEPDIYVTSVELGNLLAITGRITYPEETPEAQWTKPSDYYYDKLLEVPTNIVPPYQILDVSQFVNIDLEAQTWTERLFASI